MKHTFGFRLDLFFFLGGFVVFWVWGCLFCFVLFFIKMWSNTQLSSTAVFKSIGFKFAWPLLLRAQIVSCQTRHLQRVLENYFSTKSLFALFYVCRMKRWCLTALAILLQGWWILPSSRQWKLMQINSLKEAGQLISGSAKLNETKQLIFI